MPKEEADIGGPSGTVLTLEKVSSVWESGNSGKQFQGREIGKNGNGHTHGLASTAHPPSVHFLSPLLTLTHNN